MIVSSFIIQANAITIVNYDRKTFIVQAMGWLLEVFAEYEKLTVLDFVLTTLKN